MKIKRVRIALKEVYKIGLGDSWEAKKQGVDEMWKQREQEVEDIIIEAKKA